MASSFRRAGFGDEVSAIRDGVVFLQGGAPRMVIATSSLNFNGLAPEQQVQAALAFRDLIHAQSGPLQLYLRIRRVKGGAAEEPDERAFGDRRSYLSALTRSFINVHLQDTPVFQREVFIVLAPVAAHDRMLRSWRFRFNHQAEQPTSV